MSGTRIGRPHTMMACPTGLARLADQQEKELALKKKSAAESHPANAEQAKIQAEKQAAEIALLLKCAAALAPIDSDLAHKLETMVDQKKKHYSALKFKNK